MRERRKSPASHLQETVLSIYLRKRSNEIEATKLKLPYVELVLDFTCEAGPNKKEEEKNRFILNDCWNNKHVNT